MKLALKADEILVLRTCTKEMTGTCESSAAFVWPRRGRVGAPDWQDTDKCGHGLHGLPWGVGDASLLTLGGVWMVVRVSTAAGGYRAFGDKCKFRSGTVVYTGDRSGAVRMIDEYKPADARLVYAEQIAPEKPQQAQTAGDWSTQTAGDESTQTAGDWSTQTAGDWSYQRGGINTVQATCWYDGSWRRACRVVTAATADRWYYVAGGVWTEVTDAAKLAELDAGRRPS